MKVTLAMVVLLVVGSALIYMAADIPYGMPRRTDMDDYFLRHGQEQTGANNIVTSVLFDYRGFDTLGEATVLFTAVLGASVMFRVLRKDEHYEDD